MNRTFSKLVATAVLGLALGLSSGCVATLKSNPDAYPVDASGALPLNPGTTVDLVNGYAGPTEGSLETFTKVDLHDFTASAVTILGREFARMGVKTAPGAPKKIVLRVVDPSWVQGNNPTRTATMTLEAKYGEETLYAAGEATTGWTPDRACNLAVTHAVESLLRKPELQAYLNGN